MNTHYETVKTPLPENEDGSGYTSEENLRAVYKIKNTVLKVDKVSDYGWSVWEYTKEDGDLSIEDRLGHGLNAQVAQRLANSRALEVE